MCDERKLCSTVLHENEDCLWMRLQESIRHNRTETLSFDSNTLKPNLNLFRWSRFNLCSRYGKQLSCLKYSRKTKNIRFSDTGPKSDLLIAEASSKTTMHIWSGTSTCSDVRIVALNIFSHQPNLLDEVFAELDYAFLEYQHGKQ